LAATEKKENHIWNAWFEKSTEEISYFIRPERFAYLIGHDQIDVHGGTLHHEFFIADALPLDMLRITEGSLLIVNRGEFAGTEARFSPPAIFAMKAYMKRNGIT
jgi:hypothetical protein